MFQIFDRMGDLAGIFPDHHGAAKALSYSFSGCWLEPETPEEDRVKIEALAHKMRQQELRKKHSRVLLAEIAGGVDCYQRAELTEAGLVLRLGGGRFNFTNETTQEELICRPWIDQEVHIIESDEHIYIQYEETGAKGSEILQLCFLKV